MVGAFDPDAVQVHDVPGLWAELAAMDRLVASAKTLLARRMEDAQTWQPAGYRSAAEQLAAVSGSSVSAARNMLETSKQIEALPATADALRAGKLSAAKAEAIASAATVAPDAEAELLATAADAPLAVVRDQCLRAKAVDRDAAHARIKKGRYAEGVHRRRRRVELHCARHPRSRRQVPGRARPDRRRDVQDRPRRRPQRIARRTRSTRSSSSPNAAGTEPTRTTKTAPGFMALIRADIEAFAARDRRRRRDLRDRRARSDPRHRRPRAPRRRDPQARHHQRRRRRQRHAPRPLRHDRAEGRALVAITHVHQRRLHANPAGAGRPSARMGENPPHTPRRARPPLRARPRPQDLLRMGTHRRPRTTTVRPTRRPRHPKYRAPPDP